MDPRTTNPKLSHPVKEDADAIPIMFEQLALPNAAAMVDLPSIVSDLNALPRAGFLSLPNPFPEIQPLYRGDSRHSSQVFDEGFIARGKNINLINHTLPPGEQFSFDSAYISASTSKEVAASFPKLMSLDSDLSYVY